MSGPDYPVVGFSGSKDGLTAAQLTALEALLRRIPGARELHHGDCVGADDAAHRIAGELGWRRVVHPPTNTKRACGHLGEERLPPKEFLDRDRDIVAACSVLVTCPKTALEQLRSGTWATIRYGRRRRRPIVKVLPDGTEAWERPDLHPEGSEQ